MDIPYLFLTPYGLFLTPTPFKYPPLFYFGFKGGMSGGGIGRYRLGWQNGLKLALWGILGVSEDGYCCSDVGFWGYTEPRFASWGGVA
jgi:hypothetical protein